MRMNLTILIKGIHNFKIWIIGLLYLPIHISTKYYSHVDPKPVSLVVLFELVHTSSLDTSSSSTL